MIAPLLQRDCALFEVEEVGAGQILLEHGGAVEHGLVLRTATAAGELRGGEGFEQKQAAGTESRQPCANGYTGAGLAAGGHRC